MLDTTAGWVWPGVPRHAQTCLDVSAGFGWSESGMATIEVIQNKALIKF